MHLSQIVDSPVVCMVTLGRGVGREAVSAMLRLLVDIEEGAASGRLNVSFLNVLFNSFAQTHEQLTKKPSGIASLSFIGIRHMHVLNKQYRSKRKPTDILSFPHSLQGDATWGELHGDFVLGQIFVCMPLIESRLKFAKACSPSKKSYNGLVLKLRLARLMAHAFCHLHGFDHETLAKHRVMQRMESCLLLQASPIWRRSPLFL